MTSTRSFSWLLTTAGLLLGLLACACAGNNGGPTVHVLPRTLPPERLPAPPTPEEPEPLGAASGEPVHDFTAFFGALRSIERGMEGAHATVLHIGDSHVASDTITGEMRDLLQGRFGDAGRGYAQPGSPWRHYRQESMVYAQSREWDVETGLTREPELGPIGLSGVRLSTDAEGASVRRASCERCEFGASFDATSVHFLEHSDGGSFDIYVDGALARTVATASDVALLGVTRLELEPGPHEIEVRTHGDGWVHLLGISTERAEPGIRYESFGLNGARASHWRGLERSLVTEEVRARSPDLIVVAFGTNEAYGDRFRFQDALAEAMEESTPEEIEALSEAQWTRIDAYAREMEELLVTLLAGAPHASCLVVLPPDFHDRSAACASPARTDEEEATCDKLPPDSHSHVVAGQRRAATRVGCEVWESQAAMGGPGALRRWALLDPPLGRADGVHLTIQGYDVLAGGLYDDLMRAYERYRLTGELAFQTSPIELVDPNREPTDEDVFVSFGSEWEAARPAAHGERGAPRVSGLPR